MPHGLKPNRRLGYRYREIEVRDRDVYRDTSREMEVYRDVGSDGDTLGLILCDIGGYMDIWLGW